MAVVVSQFCTLSRCGVHKPGWVAVLLQALDCVQSICSLMALLIWGH